MVILNAVACFFFLPFVLIGCATLSQDQCLNANWSDIGYQDGTAGYPSMRLADHQNACAKHGVSPKATEYFAGREMGLRVYCDLFHAIQEGLDGRRYKGVCPEDRDPEYRELNDAAYEVYDLRIDIDTTHNQIESLEKELRKGKTSDKRKKEIRQDLHQLDQKLESLRDELRWKERDLDRLTDALKDQ
jgi:hypothetical protein